METKRKSYRNAELEKKVREDWERCTINGIVAVGGNGFEYSVDNLVDDFDLGGQYYVEKIDHKEGAYVLELKGVCDDKIAEMSIREDSVNRIINGECRDQEKLTDMISKNFLLATIIASDDKEYKEGNSYMAYEDEDNILLLERKPEDLELRSTSTMKKFKVVISEGTITKI